MNSNHPTNSPSLQLATRSVHSGGDVTLANRSKTMPIYQTSVFTFDDLDALQAYYDMPQSAFMYTRFANPNHAALEKNIADLEGAEEGIATSSGMSAIMAALLTFLKTGDHLICSSEIYGGTLNLVRKELTRLGIESTFADFTDLEKVKQSIKPSTRAVITETITNPLLHVIDIPNLSQLCREHDLKLIVDNTFSTPVLLRPLEHGADLVIHSATKYIGGHSDVTAGVVIGSGDDIRRAREISVGFGASLSPFESWLAYRGVKTLALRFEKQCENSLKLAEALEQHPRIQKVYYPGLAQHPQHALGQRLLHGGYGAMLSFAFENDRELTNRFMQSLKWVSFAPSLAGVETTISHPFTTSHRALTLSEQTELGIHYGLIRVSVGIEAVEDLIDEFVQALNKL